MIANSYCQQLLSIYACTDSVMQDLNDRLVRAGVIPGHPMFLGFIPPGHGTYPAALGGFLPAAFTTYSGVYITLNPGYVTNRYCLYSGLSSINALNTKKTADQ